MITDDSVPVPSRRLTTHIHTPLFVRRSHKEILHFLLKNNLIDGNNPTVTGKSLGENLDRWVHKHGELDFRAQDVIRPLDEPIKSTGHIRYV